MQLIHIPLSNQSLLDGGVLAYTANRPERPPWLVALAVPEQRRLYFTVVGGLATSTQLLQLARGWAGGRLAPTLWISHALRSAIPALGLALELERIDLQAPVGLEQPLAGSANWMVTSGLLQLAAEVAKQGAAPVTVGELQDYWAAHTPWCPLLYTASSGNRVRGLAPQYWAEMAAGIILRRGAATKPRWPQRLSRLLWGHRPAIASAG